MPRGRLITFRRGTSAEWAAANPVLADGEPGIDIDLNIMKIGNGFSTWTALAIAGTEGPPGTGGVNPADVGWDVVPIMGQSNALGRGEGIDTAYIDVFDSRVFMFGNLSSAYPDQVVAAKEPLFHQELPGSTVGFPLTFAKLLAQTLPPNRKVLLVPCARGNTGFASSGPYSWRPSDTGATVNLYTLAVAQITKALAVPGVNRVKAVLWHQGEANTAQTQAQYAADLDAVITDIRTRYGATVPFVIGGMSPARIATNAGYATIDAAHKDTKNRKPYIGFWGGAPLYNIGDTIHYSGAAQRLNGNTAFAAYQAALTLAGGNIASPTVTVPPEPTTPGFNDQFARDDDTVLGVTPQGKSWQQFQSGSTASWVIESGRARYAGGSAAAFAVVEGNGADGTVVGTLGTISAFPVGGLIARYVDTLNHLVLELRQSGASRRLSMFKRVANVKTLIGTGAAGTGESSDGAVLSIVLAGTQVSVKLGAATIINPVTVSDAAILTATKHGFFGASSDTANTWESIVYTP